MYCFTCWKEHDLGYGLGATCGGGTFTARLLRLPWSVIFLEGALEA